VGITGTRKRERKHTIERSEMQLGTLPGPRLATLIHIVDVRTMGGARRALARVTNAKTQIGLRKHRIWREHFLPMICGLGAPQAGRKECEHIKEGWNGVK
jgi:hypothetical protein